MKIVVYTSIFGGYDKLHENQYKMDGVDYLCFTDSDIKSDTWDIIKSIPIYNDPNRNAKKYKVLPHRYLSEYDYSIWIDGNILIVDDIRELVKIHKYQVFDHNQTIIDARNCIYEEYDAIMKLGQKNGGNYKDSPEIMYNQIKRYLNEGYPKNNGLATNPIILRNHNDSEVIKLMEDWWIEIKYGSRRDQLSFDYVVWKNNFKYKFLRGDSRKNQYFLQTGKHKGK
tara:strand:- start:7082 stop:7759 length:678 start_codon:yes stop_codon:yes gene_type:complete